MRINCFKFVFIKQGKEEDASMEMEDTILVENRRSLISEGV